MSRGGAQTLADLAVIAIAAWFLLADSFDTMPSRSLLNLVATFVIGTSLWRIWKRYRSGTP